MVYPPWSQYSYGKMLTQYKTNRHYWCLKGHIWNNIDFLLWANYLTEIRIQSYYPRLIRTSKNMCPQCVQEMIGFLWYFLRFFNGTFFNVRRKCHEICCNCFHFTHSLGSAVLFSYFLDSVYFPLYSVQIPFLLLPLTFVLQRSPNLSSE